MKEKEKFDDIIKQKFDDFGSEPPAHLWNNIQMGIGVATKTIPLWKKFLLPSSAAFVLLLISSIWLFDNNSMKDENVIEPKPSKLLNESSTKIESPETKIEKQNNVVSISEKEENFTKKSNANLPKQSIKSTIKADNKTKENNLNSLTSTQEVIKSEQKKPTNVDVKSEDNLILTNNSSDPINNNNSNQTQIDVPEIVVKQDEYIKLEDKLITKSPTADSIANQEFRDKPKVKFDYNPRNINKYFVGLYYGPEFLYNTQNQNPASNFNFTLSYQNLNFWAQTGLGMMYSREEADYIMNYNRYEFDKMQFIVTDLTPIWNNTTQQYDIVVVGHSESVYKDNNYTHKAQAYDEYYNLKIPVLVGFRKDYSNMAFYCSGGVAFNYQMFKATKGLYELDSKSTLLSLNYPILPRRKSNLEFMLNAGVGFKITRNFELNFEIVSRLYQNKMYLNPINDLPNWSAGLNVGLNYLINQ